MMDGPFSEELLQWWNEMEFTMDALFASPLHPLQRRREMEAMHRLSAGAKTIVEVGADKGGGILAWLLCVPTIERIAAIEVRGTPYKDLLRKAFPHVDFLFLSASSYERRTVEAVASWLDGRNIDALFIDGDKSMFVEDFDAYRRMVERVAFFHDIQDEAPRAAYDSVCGRGYLHAEIVDTTEVAAALTTVVPRNSYEGWLRFWRGRSCGVGAVFMEKR